MMKLKAVITLHRKAGMTAFFYHKQKAMMCTNAKGRCQLELLVFGADKVIHNALGKQKTEFTTLIQVENNDVIFFSYYVFKRKLQEAGE